MAFSKLKGSTKKQGVCKLAADADMTIYAAANNHRELVKHYNNFKRFEIDLSAVEEIDSSGIQLLLALKYSAEKDGKHLTLSAASNPVVEVMDVLNIKDQFNWSDK